MVLRTARHKSLCFIPYLLWLGMPAPRCRWGSGNTLKYGVIVRELRGKMLPFGFYPVAHINRSNAPYLLRLLFYELGHFRARLLPRCCAGNDAGLLRQQKRVTNPGARRAAFP